MGIRGARPGEPLCLLFAPLPHSQSQRARLPWRPGSRSRTKMSFTVPWAWSGSKRSSRRLGLEEGRSQAAATGRKTLNVRGAPSVGGGPQTTAQQEGARGLVGGPRGGLGWPGGGHIRQQDVPSSLQTTASPRTTSITHCPPTCLRTPAAARHPRAQDGSLEGALEPPPLGRRLPLRRGRKTRMRPVRLRAPGHSPSRPLPPHPLQYR